MNATLTDVVTDATRSQVTADCQALIEQQLDAASGLSGLGLKAAFKVVTAFAPGYYQSTVEKLVPRFLTQLQPFWTAYQGAGGGSFGDYLASRGGEVSQALLAVTDGMARGSSRAVVVKAYESVRDGAGKHIEAALPSVGALVEKYAG